MRAHLLLLVLAAGCATPAAPTGGPVDSTPPTLESSSPADGATNVTDSTIVLTFSERLDGASASAVTVTPASGTPPEVSVSGRQVEITLPALRDSTTYVVTLGTALRDNRGVALRQPITVAFGTGDAIDRASLSGRVRDPLTGDGVQTAVWGYALADSLAVPALDAEPDYRTETGQDGAFTLGYLRRAPFFVVAVRDLNRNGLIDPGERVAPPPRSVLRADTTTTDPQTFWMTSPDGTPPTAQRVRPLSDRRLAVRFDEAVRLLNTDPDPWTLADSASGLAVPLRVYQPADARDDVFIEAAQPLPPTRHVVSFEPDSASTVVDSSGLGAPAFALSFTPPARPDTVAARFAGFSPARDTVTTLAPGQRPEVVFSSAPDAATLAERVRLAEVSGVGFASTDGVTFRPVGDLPARFEVVVETPDSTFRQRYAVATARETGGIVGRVEGGGLVEVRGETGPPVVVETDAEGRFVAGGLLPGPYTLRVWRDLDGDRQWTPGRVSPYRAPEPLRLLLDPVQVRARWETEVEPITLEPTTP